MGKEFINTETDIMKVVTKILEQVKPTECNLHGMKLSDMQDDINGLGRTLGETNRLLMEMQLEATRRHGQLQSIDDKLFRNNGVPCVTQRIQDNKMSIKRHEDNHGSIKSDRKYIIGLIISILMALSALGLSFKNTDDSSIEKIKVEKLHKLLEVLDGE